ncbi:hypothetical protein P153DRAFT_389066 [Dothidotthia symphoricarpi CBS 119687]|uniref:Uncharacterized protein n=1 Tax=Dothidotthia symphoricarpi CBS 119687 TaxID=1392245 RepID=A0A6A6A3C8_9PLEO|nr:uncharacterized protein P153DRAFT_389066 [Dothidotthia symphoricarpi CBS 119687]KAF2125614.1 hypothetical protein P153DRAFT_389066 [Dothidotthia symphoricarpi CBS 119687]
MFVDLDDRIRQDLLFRLRWNISATLEHIEITIGPHDQTTNVLFLGHPLADESLADPPLSRIQVGIDVCEDKYAEEQRYLDKGMNYPYQYQPPARLTIDNEDGSPITLGQFVAQTHAYLNYNREAIIKVISETYGEVFKQADGSVRRVMTCGHPVTLPKDIGIYVSRIWVVAKNDEVSFSVCLHAEGEAGRLLKQLWAGRLTQVLWHEQKRQA